MLRPSFVPPAEIRQLRDYTRLRTDLTRDRNRVAGQADLVGGGVQQGRVRRKLRDRLGQCRRGREQVVHQVKAAEAPLTGDLYPEARVIAPGRGPASTAG